MKPEHLVGSKQGLSAGLAALPTAGGHNKAAPSCSGYHRHLIVFIHPYGHARPLSLSLLYLRPCKGKVAFCTVVSIHSSTYEILPGVTEGNTRSTRILQATLEHDMTHFSSIKNTLTPPQPHKIFTFSMLNFWKSLGFQ